jgi:uncharacterized tellurite resistance protein B-like protein
MTVTEHFRSMIAMAAADGMMSEAELRLLAHRATELGITDDEFEDAIGHARSKNISVSIPQDPAERREILKDMIRMMAADGSLNAHEKKLFAIVSTLYEVNGDQLNQLIDEVIDDG